MTGGFIHYLILIPIIYLGIATSIEDYRYGKIYRRHISLGIGVGLGWYAMLALFHLLFMDDTSFFSSVLPRVLIATMLSFSVSASMWWFNVWSAADAKLFTVFAFLTPVAVFPENAGPFHAPAVLLVNVYSAAFIVITADFLVRLSRLVSAHLGAYRAADPDTRAGMRSGFSAIVRDNWFSVLKTFLGFTLILLTFRTVRGITREYIVSFIKIDDTLLFLILFLGFRPLHRLFQKGYVAVLVVAALISYIGYLFYLDPTGGRLSELAGMGLWSLGLMSFRQIYTFWSKLVEIKSIPIGELDEHMIISQNVRSELVSRQLFSPEEIKTIGVEGLSEEFATRIKELYISEKTPGNIEIEKTIPFAPFIFIGLVATVISGDILFRLG